MIVKVAQYVDNPVPFITVAVVVAAMIIAVKVSKHLYRKRVAQKEAARLAEYQQQLHERLSRIEVSADRADYVISNDDYRRGTPRENYYRRTFFLPLLAVFGNRCANCGTSQNGVDIDHFVFSKNEGGSFAMLHREGYWVNNAIPLCETCNRTKLDRHYGDYFAAEKLIEIFEKNAVMTKQLNETGAMSQFGSKCQPNSFRGPRSAPRTAG